MPVRTRIPGLVTIEHELEVPLDHGDPGRGTITIFAREVAEPDGLDKPYLLFLQGGPGHEATRLAEAPPDGSAWRRALQDFRLLLLDQRGTGRSTPVGTLEDMSVAEQVAYLRCFRADSIVRDCELLREALGSPPWSVLGQSFGGLCATTYLSFAGDGLREVLVTGGLPPVGNRIDEVYRATWARTLGRNIAYRDRYPGDVERLAALRERLDAGAIRMPGGEPLSWRRFAQIGDLLGMSTGAEDVHHVVELPPDSPAFAFDVLTALNPPRNPIYAVLHEACWADGGTTRWSAQRTRPEADDLLLTGEHVFPWMFEEVPALRPLAGAADELARLQWPRLYDEAALRANDVPVAAAIYANDMYVERAFSEETAALVRGLHPWLTSEYEHNGLRADGGRILDRLLALARGDA